MQALMKLAEEWQIDSTPEQFNASVLQAQATIYRFLRDLVEFPDANLILQVFKDLFLDLSCPDVPRVVEALQEIVTTEQEEVFRSTLKRSCYILIKGWYKNRNYQAVESLIQLFDDLEVTYKTFSPILSQLRRWLVAFLETPDFEDLKLFGVPEINQQNPNLSHAYKPYRLAVQATNNSNSPEQRRVALALSKLLKDQFKFELAMYVARCQSKGAIAEPLRNSTLGTKEILGLIKKITITKTFFGYDNLATIFLNQIQDLTYREFKQGLKQYLFYSISSKSLLELSKEKICQKLDSLYEGCDDLPIDDTLIFKTCKRLIEYLTIGIQQSPAPVFNWQISQKRPLGLVILLLKLTLICQPCHIYLDACIGRLIQHYDRHDSEERQGFINFLEVFNVTFAVYAEDVEYTLLETDQSAKSANIINLGAYRVFAQMKVKVYPT